MHSVGPTNNRSRWVRRLTIVIIMIVVSIAAFIGGRRWEHYEKGHWYEVHDVQTFKGDVGTFELRHVTDTHGWPFLDPGDSVITFVDDNLIPIHLYQRKRYFQEQFPWVDKVDVDPTGAKWEDGEYKYSLTIERLPPTTQP